MDGIKPDSVVAFVHAKGTSERLPGKNLRVLGDVPLVCHAVRNAVAAELVDHVVIDSDSEDILAMGQAHGAIPLKRPEFLALNTASGDVLAAYQAWSVPNSRIILQVVPTSPFIQPQTIDAAIEMLQSTDYDSVVGMRSEPLYLWDEREPLYFRDHGRTPNSNELVPTRYETTGLYAIRTRCAMTSARRVADAWHGIPLSKIEAIDINTEEDFQFAEIVWKGMHAS